jgi:hypothetical protein
MHVINEGIILPILCSGHPTISSASLLPTHLIHKFIESLLTMSDDEITVNQFLDIPWITAILLFKELQQSVRDMASDINPFYEAIHSNIMDAFMTAEFSASDIAL